MAVGKQVLHQPDQLDKGVGGRPELLARHLIKNRHCSKRLTDY